ncbi:sensor histidine kinase [Pseudomonas lundensis]|uniref:sensor histidine kinase n=1 Tax=Pseudomonas lundensis TaxID=86185 RepID=UPI00186833D7|nr:HAMP domain-containing sensor histidine kinase [Pseudomonas lundensis]
MARYASVLLHSIESTKLDVFVSHNAKKIITPDLAFVASSETNHQSVLFLKLIRNDSTFDSFVKLEKSLEKDSVDSLSLLLDTHILDRGRSKQTYRIDLYCVSIYEKIKAFDSALKIAAELLQVKIQTVAVRSLFRLCRTLKQYSPADDLLEREPALINNHDFNVLYELVYYFEAKNDFHSVQSILRRIEKGFASSLPVLRTVRNFYIRFGMLEEAKRLEPAISPLYHRRLAGDQKFTAEVVESEAELASKIGELYSQLEHQKQLAAISDLTTGISHELGQPITNIRYTIQYHRRILAKQLTMDGVSKVFDSILEETERMGGLIRRLSPLTSSKSVIEKFDLMERIHRRVEGETPRLQESGTTVTISPPYAIDLIADPVKFDQLISNLLLNSIDAIQERKVARENHIEIRVESGKKEARIFFTDTGMGIPIRNRKRIFDPFFSTKPPGKGEGLGLFIVWNLLKMLGGRIAVDSKYSTGARFIVTLPKTPSDTEGNLQ